MTENFSIAVKEDNGETAIVFGGQLTIPFIQKLTQEVKEKLGQPKALHLVVKEVENIDLTFIQLLYALKNTGKKLGYPVDLQMELPDDLSSLMVNAGFGQLLNQEKKN